MSGPDSTAIAALGESIIRPKWLIFLDVLGDPLRATSWHCDVTPSGTGDADLDGFTFFAIDPQFVRISGVTQSTSGADTVTASLSGIVGPDSALLDILADPANWRGRTARLWCQIANADYADQGAIWNYFTGYMSSNPMRGDGESQTISMNIETYLAILSPASNRSYLSQSRFDAADRSAEVAAPSANGTSGTGLSSDPGFTGGGGSARGLEGLYGTQLQ